MFRAPDRDPATYDAVYVVSNRGRGQAGQDHSGQAVQDHSVVGDIVVALWRITVADQEPVFVTTADVNEQRAKEVIEVPSEEVGPFARGEERCRADVEDLAAAVAKDVGLDRVLCGSSDVDYIGDIPEEDVHHLDAVVADARGRESCFG